MTDQIQSKIQELWNVHKLTMADIAHELGVTRSVISGLVNRMRKRGIALAARTNAPNPQRGKQKLRKANLSVQDLRKLTAKSRGWARKKELVAKAPPKTNFESMPDDPQIMKNNCLLADLTPRSCRFILNDPRGKIGALYCGEEIEVRSYCRQHYDLCYYPSKGKDG